MCIKNSPTMLWLTLPRLRCDDNDDIQYVYEYLFLYLSKNMFAYVCTLQMIDGNDKTIHIKNL